MWWYDTHQISFQIDVLDVQFKLETLAYGKAEYDTKRKRHYLLRRLLAIQLRNFDNA